MAFYANFLKTFPQYKNIPIPNTESDLLTQAALIELSRNMQTSPQLSAYVYESYEKNHKISPIHFSHLLKFAQDYVEMRRFSDLEECLPKLIQNTEFLNVKTN